ncbi:hypothetical protein LPC08_07930 [Roseomonas sp. OT10]|uniref:hypothetical protein n=1 Tax=Roseomonas cutis TaxID=2897332 RepID=UPI001E3F720F|nr:hypothetical protein [Roseomonas sp. OT10]UFN50534.1 hypothetical protein LPC08_07930 [Roseomonas sp. OT10]
MPPPAAPPLAVQVVAGLHGAFLLARGQVRGLAFMQLSPEGTVRSFWAALICLPAFLGLRLLGEAGESTPDSLQAVLAELLGYVITWAGFALASLGMAVRLGRAALWPRFIAAWNWANVVQYLVLSVLLLFSGEILGPVAGLLAVGYALWLEGFVTRTALQIGWGTAAGFVAFDLAISLLVTGVVQSISGS